MDQEVTHVVTELYERTEYTAHYSRRRRSTYIYMLFASSPALQSSRSAPLLAFSGHALPIARSGPLAQTRASLSSSAPGSMLQPSRTLHEDWRPTTAAELDARYYKSARPLTTVGSRARQPLVLDASAQSWHLLLVPPTASGRRRQWTTELTPLKTSDDRTRRATQFGTRAPPAVSPADKRPRLSLSRVAGPSMISEPLQTLRGSGYLPSFNRSPSAKSPLSIQKPFDPSSSSNSISHREPSLAPSGQRLSPLRPSSGEAREEAIRTLSRGVGISYTHEPAWSQRPWKFMPGCSGVIGI